MAMTPAEQAMFNAITAQFEASKAGPGTSGPMFRRPALAEPHSYTLRISLHDSSPTIWRRLQVNSDITLDTLHLAIQGAFDWYNSHLHRFAIGHPFDRESELFLCEWDVENGEASGLPTHNVRLDETLQVPGDVLEYIYDYGDNWDLQIRLETVGSYDPEAPVVTCIDGERAAPPEDCGSRRTAEDLAEILKNPAYFNLDEANESIEASLCPGYAEAFLAKYAFHDGTSFVELDLKAATTSDTFDLEAEFEAALWFLRRVGDGLKLTQAGYLPPIVAREFRDVLFSDDELFTWSATTEYNLRPLHSFRLYLQKLGLTRKYRGSLLLTRAGAAAAKNPEAFWNHLVERYAAAFNEDIRDNNFENESVAFTLAYAATFNGKLDMDRVSAALSERGWRRSDGSRLSYVDVVWSGFCPQTLLSFMGPRTERDRPTRLRFKTENIRPAAVALAHAAIERGLTER